MPTAAGTTPNTLSPPDATNASTAASSAAAGEVSGYLTVRYKGGKKTRWKRKHAVLRQDTIYLADEQGSSAENTTELKLPSVFNSCGPYNDKKAIKKKHGFVLEPAMDGEEQDQWYFTCEDQEDQQRWMNAINDVISGKKVQKAVSCPEFDEIIVQTTTLNHLAKDRPRFHGRRLPAKRPMARSENALNGIPENENAAKMETPDSSQPNSPARDLATTNGASSAPSSPANKGFKDSPVVKRRHEAKKRGTFLRGIGARVSRIFTSAQPPRSPTSPGRLNSETIPSTVLPHITVDKDNSKSRGVAITKVDEDDEDVPVVVTKEDIIKMLDFVSESTEQIVYKAVGIRGAISSVDEHKSQETLKNTSRSLRQAVKALKGTLDSLTSAEEAMKSATDVRSSPRPSPRPSPRARTAARGATPINGSVKSPEANPEVKHPQKVDLNRSNEFDSSLENADDFDVRHQSISLMESIQKTLNNGANKSAAAVDDDDEIPQADDDVMDSVMEDAEGPLATSEKKLEDEPLEPHLQSGDELKQDSKPDDNKEQMKDEPIVEEKGEHGEEKEEGQKPTDTTEEEAKADKREEDVSNDNNNKQDANGEMDEEKVDETASNKENVDETPSDKENAADDEKKGGKSTEEKQTIKADDENNDEIKL